MPDTCRVSTSGRKPRSGATRRIISAATGTAVQPAVRRGLRPLVSTGSSSVTIKTYFGLFVGKTDANVLITLSL